MHRERHGQTQRERERDREDGQRERERERERELADFVDFSLDNSILSIVANCIPRRKSEVGGFRSCHFFLCFGSFRFLVVLAAPASFPIGVGFFFCR